MDFLQSSNNSLKELPKMTFTLVERGIEIPIGQGGAKKLRLTVISDKIVRVTATASDYFSTRPSLCILPNLALFSDWRVEQEEDTITLQTPALSVVISLPTGVVKFYDTNGQPLLQEIKEGGKYIAPTSFEEDEGYIIQQKFDSPDDEAFYGLGGHQNRQLNYKGEDVELSQQNLTAVVPFLYSNKNYGLLWDNYSITKFGDPRAYRPLDGLLLYDKTGKLGGLTTDYYVDNKIIETRLDDKIDFEFLETPQVDNFPKEVIENGKVVWQGAFSADKSGKHKFLVHSSGYVKIWIDGELILDSWRQGWNPWINKFTVPVQAGIKHDLKIEWIPDGVSFLAVKYLEPYPEEEQQQLCFTSEMGDQIDYYFIKGNSADEVIAGYRYLTGKVPLLPNWSLGFWQSRERYKTEEELIGVLQEYRQRKIPIDNIVIDWQYWESAQWGSHEFDLSRFPQPKKMINTIQQTFNAKVMVSVWPKFYLATKHYKIFRERGLLFNRNADLGRIDWVNNGYVSTFYNPFKQAGRQLYWEQLEEKLLSMGVDAWWLDATEPDIHPNVSLYERKLNMHPTGIGSGERYFNAYSLLNTQSVYEGQRKSDNDQRIFILTRSAFAGQQRYGAVTWSGDTAARWSDLKDQIVTGINFSLSGIPYWTMDIGGFAVEKKYEEASGEILEEWRELHTRWFQFGAFCPIFRLHGQYPFREIYNIAPVDHPAYETMVYYTHLRYRLLPYIYSMVSACYYRDYTIMRGLVMDFPNDQKVINVADQYLFGSSLLINPVTDYKQTTRKVYLPKSCGWFDFYTGKYYEGNQSILADAPYQRMPIYIKEGAIIPMGEEQQYVAEKQATTITLLVYGGQDATFMLYEDEGVNYNYENNQFATIDFFYKEANNSLTIMDRQGNFPNMLQKRTFEIIKISKEQPYGIDVLTDVNKTIINYTGKKTMVYLQ